MKNLFKILLIFVIFVTGCTKNNINTSVTNKDKIKVVTTIFPIYDFVREIGGDNLEVEMLLPFGTESHSFEPTPQDIVKIQNADIFIYVGGESEEWANKILGSLDISNINVLPILSLVDTLEEEIVEGMNDDNEDHDHDGEDHNHEDHDHDHDHNDYIGNYESMDEHIWTSPKNAKKIVLGILDTLVKSDPKNKKAYEENTENYIAKLDNLDSMLSKTVLEGNRNTIIFGDRFPFRYLVNDYGLSYYAAFPGCSTESEPSAANLAFLINKVKQENIPVVFNIEFSNEKISDAILESTNSKKLLLHSAHNISKADFENGVTYIDLMERNIQNLKEALK